MISVNEFQKSVVRAGAILNEYLQRHFEASTIGALSHGSWNATFRALTGDGRSLFVKVLNDETSVHHRSKEAVGWACTIVVHGEEQTLDIAVPVLRNKNGALVGCAGDWKVLVYPWINHKEDQQLREDGPQEKASIARGARALARLHEYLSTSEQGEAWRSEPPQCVNLRRWMLESEVYFDTVEEQLRRRYQHDGITKRILHHAREHTASFIQRNADKADAADEKADILHGDFRPENIIVDNRAKWWIADYDMAHVGKYLSEAVYAALSFAGRRWLSPNRDWNKVRLFVELYSNERGLRLEDEEVQMEVEWALLRGISASYKRQQLLSRMELYEEWRALKPTLGR